MIIIPNKIGMDILTKYLLIDMENKDKKLLIDAFKIILQKTDCIIIENNDDNKYVIIDDFEILNSKYSILNINGKTIKGRYDRTYMIKYNNLTERLNYNEFNELYELINKRINELKIENIEKDKNQLELIIKNNNNENIISE